MDLEQGAQRLLAAMPMLHVDELGMMPAFTEVRSGCCRCCCTYWALNLVEVELPDRRFDWMEVKSAREHRSGTPKSAPPNVLVGNRPMRSLVDALGRSWPGLEGSVLRVQMDSASKVC